MKDLNLEIISQLVSEKLGKTITFVTVEQIGDGYQANGYKLIDANGHVFFAKDVKANNLGLEFPERHIMTLLMSTSMGERAAGKNPAPIGVIIVNEDSCTIFPQITHTTRVFHIQEFGGTGTSYSSILTQNIHKKSIDETDRAQLTQIAEALVEIHTVTHPTEDTRHRDILYNDGIRNVLTHPELSLTVLSEFPSDYPVLDLSGQKEIIGLMYENIKHWMHRGDRLSALHGDFWGANIFFREDGSLFIVDFSRIPWGDPAIDVGWFMSEMLFKYHETGNEYFKELTNTWIEIYKEKSGDTELEEALPLALGWIGIIQVYPRFFPDLDVALGKKWIAHISKILQEKRFCWPK